MSISAQQTRRTRATNEAQQECLPNHDWTPPPALRVARDDWARFLPCTQGWRTIAIALDAASGIRFRTGQIGPQLRITHSDARLNVDFHSWVEQPGPGATLCFGLAGTSLFRFGTQGAPHAVRAGDIWLFHGIDAAISRHTPVQPRAAMVAVRLPMERLTESLDGLLPANDGTRAIYLDRMEPQRLALTGLLDNPLASPLERLLAESQVLALLARSLAPLSDAPLAAEDGKPTSASLARVVERLAANLCQPPSLDDLAREAGMSHARLNRCFRRAYGKTVFAWLRDYRLERARLHLRQDGYSITEIAFLCGFSSASHFAAAFRHRHGCAPAAYRQRKHAGNAD